jgi:hypothetical protein
MQAIIDVIAFAVLASGYGVWRLARWIIGW